MVEVPSQLLSLTTRRSKGPPPFMLTREDDVDAHALHRRTGRSPRSPGSWLGHDRKTIRAYLTVVRVVGQRRRAVPDPVEPFAGYCRERVGRGSASVGDHAVR